MKNRLHTIISITFMLAGNCVATANAQAPAQGEAGYVAREQAQESCADKDSGDVCSFVNSAGDSINGSCGYQGGGVGGKLVCIPIH
jgi:hypothetical protein